MKILASFLALISQLGSPGWFPAKTKPFLELDDEVEVSQDVSFTVEELENFLWSHSTMIGVNLAENLTKNIMNSSFCKLVMKLHTRHWWLSYLLSSSVERKILFDELSQQLRFDVSLAVVHRRLQLSVHLQRGQCGGEVSDCWHLWFRDQLVPSHKLHVHHHLWIVCLEFVQILCHQFTHLICYHCSWTNFNNLT